MNDEMKELEQLREYIFDMKETTVLSLVEQLEGISEFDKGRFQGILYAFDDVSDYINKKLKYYD